MLIDSFIFFNEIELLNLRMRELYDLVDFFVVVEAGHTFAGKKKPFYIERYYHDLADPASKLIYVKLPRLPPLVGNTEKARFWLESYHRNGIMEGLLRLGLSNDDYVMVSDVDEIPSAAAVNQFLTKCGNQDVFQFSQMFLKYYFDDEINDGYNRMLWGGTVGVRYSAFSKALPQDIRRVIGLGGQVFDKEEARKRNLIVGDQGGWHLSSFGGSKAQAYKVSHYAHGIHADVIMDDDASLTLSADRSLKFTTPIEQARELVSNTELAISCSLPRAVKENPGSYLSFFKSFGSK